MTLQEMYSSVEGDYESAAARLMTEALVKKFVLKFLDDKSFELLSSSLEKGDYDEAYRGVHTIKGICQNLSFTKLFSSSNALTQAMKEGREADYQTLFEEVKKDYNQTVAAIKELDA